MTLSTSVKDLLREEGLELNFIQLVNLFRIISPSSDWEVKTHLNFGNKYLNYRENTLYKAFSKHLVIFS